MTMLWSGTPDREAVCRACVFSAGSCAGGRRRHLCGTCPQGPSMTELLRHHAYRVHIRHTYAYIHQPDLCLVLTCALAGVLQLKKVAKANHGTGCTGFASPSQALCACLGSAQRASASHQIIVTTPGGGGSTRRSHMRRLLSAYAGLALLIGLVCCVAGQSTCGFDYTLGVRANGALWPDFFPAVNSNGTAISNSFIPADQQGQNVTTPAECNCRCAAVSTCVAYTWLGGQQQQCWLHSYVQFYATPVTSPSDLSVPADSVLGRVVRDTSSWATCSKLSLQQGSFTGTSSTNITTPTISSVTAAGCNQACGQEPACVAFRWTGSKPTAAGNCTLYSSVTGVTPATSGTSYTGLLQACGEQLVPGPTPSVGTCGIDAAPGFRYTGKVLPGWVPLPGSGALSINQFVQRDIPLESQNQTRPNAAECNCLCTQVDACVGYTWLGGDLKQCWLHSYVEWWTRPEDLSDTYHNTEDPFTQLPVPADTVIGRRIDKTADWPLCGVGTWNYPNGFAIADNSSITAILPGPVNSSQCNQACGNDPFCVGYQWQSTDDFGNGISVGPCSLFSTAQGFGGGPPPVGAAATFCATLQRCLADSLPETYNSQLVGGNPPPAPPLPPAPQLVAAPATSCKFDASPGIRHQGQIWRSWLPVLGYGNAGDAPQTAVTTADTEVVVSPASNKYIPAGKQGVKTNSFQECNCRCAAIDTCIGYTWLGGTIQECWLHSFVNFYEDTDYVVQQSAAAGGGYIPVPSDTILGRVIKTVSNDTLPCNQTIYNAGVAPAVRTSNRIRNNPIDPVAPQDCNFRCLQDPYCVAYSWMGLDANDAALCTMYSEVSGAPTPISPPDAIFFMASLQVCKELRVAPPGPPSPPSPPPAPPTPPAPPGAAGVNGSTTCDVTADAASVGIKYTGKVWKNWAPIKGYGGSGLDQNVYASNAYISDSVQGQPADTAADCNCRCNDEAVCIGYTWLGAQRKECWLHSSVTWYSDPVDSFFDPLSPSSDPTPAPADAVLARVVPTATRSSAFVSCGLDLVQDYQPAVVNTSGITQSTDPLPPFYCASECLKEPLCVGFTWQAQSADPTNDAVCTLLSGASGGIVPVAASNGLRTFMAPLQSCRALKTSPPIPVPAPPAPPAPAPGPATACPADSSAGIKWSAGGVVLPGWWPRYRAGWSKTDAINPNTTAWSNNYIPDDMQGATTASPTECNCRCINATACVAYTWLGGAYKQCWLHSWVEWFANPVNTFQDVNTGNQVAVPADTVVARVIKAADWPLCNATGKYFSKQGIQSASSAGITRTPPRGVSWQACNQECGRDPACVAFSWTGTVDPANDPVGGNSLNCQLYSNVSGGLVFNSSENGVVYTSPLQACPEALQDLQGQAPNQGIYTTSSSSGSSSSSSLSAGAIAGIVIGAVLGTLAIAALLFAVFVWRRKPRGFNGFSAVPGSKSIVSGSTADSLWSLGLSTNQTGRHTPMAVPGLAKGEIFTRATAYEYSWLTTPLDLASVQAVEAGINDQELDTMFKSAGGSGGGELPPVIELSKEDLKQQVQLVQNGLLGRGATALVFQCVWPSRFGPNSLLAVKVLKDGHEVDPLVLQSFAYEANVLASTEHPCVIRLYGYCLEPPTVCLILELLPYSLKDLLYGIQAHADTTQPRPVHPSQLHTSQLPLTLHTGSDLSPKTMSTIQHTTGTAPPIMVVVTPEEDASNISGTHPAAPGTTPAEKQASGSLGVPPGPMTASSDAPAPMPIIRPYAVLDSRSTPDFMGTTGTSLSSTATGMALPSPGCKPPPLTMAQVLRISTEIAAGLAYLHDRPVYNTPAHLGHAVLTLEEHSPANTSLNNAGMKIVHRDLKPANILINSRGRAKISDFGLARKTQRTTVHTERLGAGTLPYMAPELLAGATSGNAYKLAPTNRVDIYSLSMMMWEMVSGQQPWSDKNEVAIMSAVIRNQRPELPNLPKTTEAAARPDIDHLPASLSALPEFNSIVRACWSQRELKRPTAAAVFNMLCGVLRQYGHAPPEDLSVTIPQPLPAPEQADEPRE